MNLLLVPLVMFLLACGAPSDSDQYNPNAPYYPDEPEVIIINECNSVTLWDMDLAGNCRHNPPTMGALEVDDDQEAALQEIIQYLEIGAIRNEVANQ